MTAKKRQAPTNAQGATDGGGAVTSTPPQPQVPIRKLPVFSLIQTGFYSGASSFWIPTRPDISLSAIIPQETNNPSLRLVLLSNNLFSSQNCTCQRWRNTYRPWWNLCGETSFIPCGTLISQCILRPLQDGHIDSRRKAE